MHHEAGGTAAGVRLPVILAVARDIIYADLNLMEHMCVCSRHSSQISRNGARTSDSADGRNARPRQAYGGNPITHLHAHTQPCALYLYIMETPRCMCSMHSTARAH